MHELGTIHNVLETVEKLAAEHQLTKIGSVTLEVGEVSGIIPRFLSDYKKKKKKKTTYLQDAELKIETIHAVTYCQDCGKTYPTLEFAKICPYCKSENTFLVTGNEYIIKEVEAM